MLSFVITNETLFPSSKKYRKNSCGRGAKSKTRIRRIRLAGTIVVDVVVMLEIIVLVE